MKNVIWIFYSILILSSCSSPTKEETAIADYVQRIRGTKTEMSFKMKELAFIKDITKGDSLRWFTANYSERDDRADSLIARLSRQAKPNRVHLNELFELNRKAIGMMQSGNTYTGKIGVKLITKIDSAMKVFQPVMERDSIILNNLIRYNSDTASVVSKEYTATYTIKNPFLNNAEQELTKIFYLNASADSVIRSQ